MHATAVPRVSRSEMRGRGRERGRGRGRGRGLDGARRGASTPSRRG